MLYNQFIATFFLLLFTLVATVDGIYFHLYKYRLFEKPECQKEHFLHSLNALLFPFTVVLLFVINSAGILLWITIGLIILTLIIEFIDVFEENKSRKNLGGLTSLEYSMHFGMAGLRSTFTVLILAQKPFSAWSLWSPMVIQDEYHFYVRVIGMCVAVLGVPVFLLHFYLGRRFAEYKFS